MYATIGPGGSLIISDAPMLNKEEMKSKNVKSFMKNGRKGDWCYTYNFTIIKLGKFYVFGRNLLVTKLRENFDDKD